jgi:hypothetical protein
MTVHCKQHVVYKVTSLIGVIYGSPVLPAHNQLMTIHPYSNCKSVLTHSTANKKDRGLNLLLSHHADDTRYINFPTRNFFTNNFLRKHATWKENKLITRKKWFSLLLIIENSVLHIQTHIRRSFKTQPSHCTVCKRWPYLTINDLTSTRAHSTGSHL